jgi:hypothetical protein
MIRVAFASIVLSFFSSTTQADAAADLQAAQQLALKFLATIDRGELDQAIAMYALPPTQAGQAMKLVAGVNLPAEATRELTRQHEEQLAQALAQRRVAVQRSVTARKNRGAVRNARVKGSTLLHGDVGYVFLVESDASVPVRHVGAETTTTMVSITVTRSEPSAPYYIQSFQTEY